MGKPVDGSVTIERNGRQYSATYSVIGGVVSITPTIGDTEDLDIGTYDMPLDELAKKLLNEHVDAYLKKNSAKPGKP